MARGIDYTLLDGNEKRLPDVLPVFPVRRGAPILQTVFQPFVPGCIDIIISPILLYGVQSLIEKGCYRA